MRLPYPILKPTVTALATLMLLVGTATVSAAASHRWMFDGLSAAASAVVQLQGSLSGITLLNDYTQDTDPEHLLGLPGQYIAKANLHDAALSRDSQEVTGSIEVFASARDLNSRKLAIGRAFPYEGNFSTGLILVRLFSSTTPDQLAAYRDATQAIVIT